MRPLPGSSTRLRMSRVPAWFAGRSSTCGPRAGRARALTYQLARGASLDGMGVIVQRQVASALSGVLFTVAPDHDGEMLVEYCGGSGEALVAGRVNPGRVRDRSRQSPLVDAGDARRRRRDRGVGHSDSAGRHPSEPRAPGARHRARLRSSSGHRMDDGRGRPALDRAVAADHGHRCAARLRASSAARARLDHFHGAGHLLVERQRQRELSAADHAAPLLHRATGLLPLLPQPRARVWPLAAPRRRHGAPARGTSSASTARGCTTT